MENALSRNSYRKRRFAGLWMWTQQTARPFVARWWMWIAFIISPAYLAHYFAQSSLEERLRTGIERVEKREEELLKEGRLKTSIKENTNVFFQSGYRFGWFMGLLASNGLVLFMIALLMLALLELQYQFVFQKLFEQDAIGRRVYIALVVISWLGLAVLMNRLVGKTASQSGLGWTIANWFILLNIGYSLFVSWRNAGRRQLVLIQQKVQAELDALKAQVNPHFLFNSLNNIYGTAIGENSPRTAESIQQLSGIVRYVMEESRQRTTDIQRELRFIDDFVELQRIRLPNQDTIEIKVAIDWDEKPAQIVPLLLNPLVENAFKYGISIQYPCFVHIWLRVQEGVLDLKIENSVLPRTNLEKGTGLGLANVRQRLALAYPNRHQLTIEENDKTFLITLMIRL